ncbi:MAG: flavodoxin [Actinobacteria bacterium]|nr:MAG: flavodoxin [Actinomycetota bacterium]
MRVVVSAASKHGSTAEIAAAIANRLREAGFTADVVEPGEIDGAGDFEAAVIGSAVYAGHWMPVAKEMVRTHSSRLLEVPVWLFSSGPVGEPPKPEEDPVDAVEMIELADPVEHRVFAGKIDPAKVGFAEKAIIKALRAPVGDYREWNVIEAWTDEIAAALQKEWLTSGA